jgi:hypothetical protein
MPRSCATEIINWKGNSNGEENSIGIDIYGSSFRERAFTAPVGNKYSCRGHLRPNLYQNNHLPETMRHLLHRRKRYNRRLPAGRPCASAAKMTHEKIE